MKGWGRLHRAGASPALRSVAALSLLTALAATGLTAAGAAASAAPAAPVLTGTPPAAGSSTAPTWDFTVTAGAVPECSLVPAGDSPVFGPCTTGTSYVGALVSDGSYTFAVREQSPLADGALAGSDYRLDRVATVAVTAPASPGSTLSPAWQVVPDADATATCTFAGTVVPGCSGTFTGTLPPGSPDGAYDLVVDVTDSVGNTGSVTSTYVLDTTAPGAPVVTGSSGLGRTQPTWTWSTAGAVRSTCTLVGPVGQGPVDCSSGQWSPALTSDGTYHADVVLTDAAGNDSAPGSGPDYELDTTPPPAAVITAEPVSPGKDTTPTWGFTAGSATTCRLTGATHGAQPAAACTSPFTAAALADDTWTLEVLTADAAGNTAGTTSSGYVLTATTRPVAPVVTTPANPSQNGSPAWTWTAEPGTTAECEGITGGVPSGTWTACTSGAPFPLPAEGSYQIGVRLTDVNGLVSDVTTSAPYVYDVTPPAAPTVTAPASPSSARSASFTFPLESGATATCRLLSGGTEVLPAAPCTSPATVDLSGRPDGDYDLEVVETDAAGNVGAAGTSTRPYTLDTTAPAAPVVTGPATPSTSSLTFSWPAEAGATSTCQLLLDGAPSGTAAVCVSPYSPAVATDGTWSLQVTLTDTAGNTSAPGSSQSYLLDRVAPPVPTGPTPSQASPSSTAVVSWSFQVEQGATALCSLRSATASLIFRQPCSSPWTTDLRTLADDSYTVLVRAVDAAGNVGSPASATYVLDRTAPTPPTISGSPGSPAPDRTPTWSVLASDPADTLQCRLSGLPGSTWGSCTDPVTYDLGTASSGSYQLAVRETDAAGNTSGTTTSEPYVLDLLAPPVPMVLPPDPQRSNGRTPAFQVVKDAADTDTLSLRCTATRFDGSPAVATPCAFGANVVDVTGLHGDGPVVLEVSGVDASGNTSATGTASYAFDDVPPASAKVLAPEEPVSFSATPTWTFAGPRDAVSFRCELRRAGDVGPLVRSRCASPYTVRLPSPGDYTLSVWAVDGAGNLSLRAGSAGYRQLSTIPTPGVPVGPTSGSDASPTWTFKVPSGYGATCLLGLPGGGGVEARCAGRTAVMAGAHGLPAALSSAAAAVASLTSSGSWTADLSGRPRGTYTLRVQLVDAFGNEGAFGGAAGYRYAPVTAATGVPGAASGGSSAPPAVRRTPPVVGHPATAAPRTGVVAPPAKAARPAPRAVARPERPQPGLLTTEVPKAIAQTVTQAISRPTIPLLLLTVVVGFLLLQNRIDRRDPKLRAAPVGPEPELEFGPALGAPRGRMQPGGVTA